MSARSKTVDKYLVFMYTLYKRRTFQPSIPKEFKVSVKIIPCLVALGFCKKVIGKTKTYIWSDKTAIPNTQIVNSVIKQINREAKISKERVARKRLERAKLVESLMSNTIKQPSLPLDLNHKHNISAEQAIERLLNDPDKKYRITVESISVIEITL